MNFVRSLILVIITFSLVATAAAEPKGWGLGAGAHDGDFGLQLRKDFWLGGDVSQITGQGSVYWHHRTTFKIDADYHFILNPESPSRFYPLAGLQFAFNSDSAKLGANLGGGAKFKLTEKTAAFAEIKWVLGDWDGFGFVVGFYI